MKYVSLTDLCFFILFIYLEREKERESVSGGRAERGRERIPCRFYAVNAEPNTGLKPTNHEIMT